MKRIAQNLRGRLQDVSEWYVPLFVVVSLLDTLLFVNATASVSF